MPVKLLTSGGGGVNLVPSSSIASDVTVAVPSKSGTTVLTDVADNIGIAATGANYITMSTNGSERVRIDSSGNMLVGTTSGSYKLTLNGQPGANGYTAWTNYSDARLKENVTDLKTENVLTKVCSLRPVTFNYNDKSGFDEDTRKRRISGFIAQELQQVFPDMVGTTEINGFEYLDTNLSNFTLYLLQAIKEQQAIIESLTQRIEALEYTKQGE